MPTAQASSLRPLFGPPVVVSGKSGEEIINLPFDGIPFRLIDNLLAVRVDSVVLRILWIVERSV